MSGTPVNFMYVTGVGRPLFAQARLKGSWDAGGHYSDNWSAVLMQPTKGPDGCPAFAATVTFASGQVGRMFRWGVEICRNPGGPWEWGIMTEVNRADSSLRERSFQLQPTSSDGDAQQEFYYLNHSRRLGAQKHYRDPHDPKEQPGIRFEVWAPNAQSVEVVMAALWRKDDPSRKSMIDPANGIPAIKSQPKNLICGGYLADNVNFGQVANWGPFKMTNGVDGIWTTDPNEPALKDFAKFDHVPYMYRVKKDNGKEAYRTDLFSRCQIGFGATRPNGTAYMGRTMDLDGTVSCSVVVDPDRVTKEFSEPDFPETNWLAQEEFFAEPAPDPQLQGLNLEDLVIYELHIGALGAKRAEQDPGTLEDAIQLLDYLQDLGVNAVELLPLSEFGGGGAGWGYATSHYFAIEYSGGGRDNYKWFIRECHARGIAVILDVVYNHYNHNAERAEWLYDTDGHQKNAYYWYEGSSSDYPEFDAAVGPERRGQGGYVDNMSTAWAPRYWEENVRNMFVSSAIALAMEFNVDGFRMDQTTSIHAYNQLHGNGRQVGAANQFGQKLLRELTRSIKFVNSRVMLTAEDHSNWDMVTENPNGGGLGFDATWYSDFYHHLIGDTDKGSDYAKLIKTAGLGDDRPLAMDYFAGVLQATGGKKVVYHESHDEAGNGAFTHRTIKVAVNGAPLTGDTRRYGEARCRFAAGVTILSAGTPMFLFGEEVGAEKDFLYGQVLENREDLQGLRAGSGRNLFEFYRRLIRLRLAHPGLKSRQIDVLFVHNDHRLILFRRWGGDEEFLVVASLNNHPFNNPSYVFRADRIPGGRWREVFNSDSAVYGGDNVGNLGAQVSTQPGILNCVVPANGILVFQRAN
jgi:1,4-alpha-glucan branching enzyme